MRQIASKKTELGILLLISYNQLLFRTDGSSTFAGYRAFYVTWASAEYSKTAMFNYTRLSMCNLANWTHEHDKTLDVQDSIVKEVQQTFLRKLHF